MDIAIPLFDRFTALDAVGPYEALSRLPGARVTFIAAEPGPVVADTRTLTLTAERSLDDLPNPEILLVPGGVGTRALMDDARMLKWIRTAHETSQWTTSVCTGALLLGAAGILDGLKATTYWVVLETLASFGATPVKERVVEDGKVMTAAGVSSGIDMALTLIARLANDDVAKAIQLGIEYDPQPPFDAGSPDKAPPELVEGVRAIAQSETQTASA